MVGVKKDPVLGKNREYDGLRVFIDPSYFPYPGVDGEVVTTIDGRLFVYNGNTEQYIEKGSGQGGGDMLKSVYDPAGGERQVAFADEIQTYTAGDGIEITQDNVIKNNDKGTSAVSSHEGAYDHSLFITPSSTNTLTNKRIIKRVASPASSVSYTLDIDNYDCYSIVSTEPAGTLTINAPTGTPTNFQKLQIRISATATQTLSWNTIYRGTTDVALPTTIGANKEIELGFEYHSASGRRYLLALTNII